MAGACRRSHASLAPLAPSHAAALVALLAVLAAQATSVLHAALAEHDTCPEHGELLEAAAPRTPNSIPDREQAGIAAVEGSAPHHHEPCLVSLSAQPRALCGGAEVLRVASERPLSAAKPSAAGPVEPPVAILRVAPKSSPPQA